MTENLRALPIGQIISDYRIDKVLGQGGFGITYLATDIQLNFQYAIKEYYPREYAVRDSTLTVKAAGSQEDRETFNWGLDRFLDEAKVLAKFKEPNIVAVRRFFKANGTAYLVMDYCEGGSLDELVKQNGPINSVQLNQILFPLLDGLERVHATNFLHRDIKPANVFIRDDGSPVLLDFGSARQEISNHSMSVTSFATQHYAAFEQYGSKSKQGPATDIYGLSATLYRALTGDKPQDSADRMMDDNLEPLRTRLRGKVPEHILQGLDWGLALRPIDRPQSIAEWRAILLKGSQNSYASPEVKVEQKLGVQKKINGLEGVNLHLKKDTSNPQKFITLVWLVAGLIIFLLIRGLSMSHDSVVDDKTLPTPVQVDNVPAKNKIPTPSASSQGQDKSLLFNQLMGVWAEPDETCSSQTFGFDRKGSFEGLGMKEVNIGEGRSITWDVTDISQPAQGLFHVTLKKSGQILEEDYKVMSPNALQIMKRIRRGQPKDEIIIINGKWFSNEKNVPISKKCGSVTN